MVAPDVLDLLAHRYPMLLLDRITALDAGQRAQGIKRVTSNEWFMAGSGTAAMPGVLILEALAQLSGAVLLGLAGGASGGAVGYFVGLDRVRFRGAARAGDTLELEVALVQYRRGVCRTRGSAWVDGRRIVRAELTTVLRASVDAAPVRRSPTEAWPPSAGR